MQSNPQREASFSNLKMKDLSFSSKKTAIQPLSASFSQDWECPHVSESLKFTVVEWLQALNCSHIQPDSSLCWLEDPFRNGVLVTEAVGVVLGKEVQFDPAPRNEAAIRRNYGLALSAVQRNKPCAFNYQLYSQAYALTQGREDWNWALLWSLYNAYSQFLPPRLASVRPDLPYDLVSIVRLETALISWLASLGVVKNCANFTALLPTWTNGSLLARTVSLVCRTPIEGVFEGPKSEGGALSNLRKALDLLKQAPCMSQKFVWGRERDILKGSLGVALGLLEDLYRFCDGQPARKPGPNYHSDGPYLGLLHSLQVSCEPSPLPSPPHWKPCKVNLTAACVGLVPSKLTIQPQQPSEVLVQWLLEKGVPAQLVIDLNRGRTDSFRDGVLLCELVAGLTRKELGVERAPSTAAGRQNLRRALTLLQQQPSFPLECSELSLAEGETQAWVRLLGQLRRLFPHSQFKLRRHH